MKNSLPRKLYHWFVVNAYKIKSYRGGWILTSCYIDDYKNFRPSQYLNIAASHIKGWSYSDWKILQINNNIRRDYLSTLQYARMHPFNSEYSHWIDDKLTLKYMLNGTIADKYMPKYYFQITKGNIIALMDFPDKNNISAQSILELLQKEGDLAIKLLKGAQGKGFYHAKVKSKNIYVNENIMTDEDFVNFIKSLDGYIVTEYILPHPDLARFNNKTPGCLRYILGKMKSGEWIPVYSFMRLGTKVSNNVENFNAGGVLMEINDGIYNGGYIFDKKTYKPKHINEHPDNHIILNGKLPLWDQVEKASLDIASLMPQLTYLGFDFCITEKNEIKLLEINTWTSLDAIQTNRSIFECPGGEFFKERLVNG